MVGSCSAVTLLWSLWSQRHHVGYWWKERPDAAASRPSVCSGGVFPVHSAALGFFFAEMLPQPTHLPTPQLSGNSSRVAELEKTEFCCGECLWFPLSWWKDREQTRPKGKIQQSSLGGLNSVMVVGFAFWNSAYIQRAVLAPVGSPALVETEFCFTSNLSGYQTLTVPLDGSQPHPVPLPKHALSPGFPLMFAPGSQCCGDSRSCTIQYTPMQLLPRFFHFFPVRYWSIYIVKDKAEWDTMCPKGEAREM